MSSACRTLEKKWVKSLQPVLRKRRKWDAFQERQNGLHKTSCEAGIYWMLLAWEQDQRKAPTQWGPREQERNLQILSFQSPSTSGFEHSSLRVPSSSWCLVKTTLGGCNPNNIFYSLTEEKVEGVHPDHSGWCKFPLCTLKDCVCATQVAPGEV